MRSSFLLAVCAAVGLFGFVVSAAERPPDEYVKAMKDLGPLSAGVKKALETDDFDAVTKLQLTAKDAFAVVEKYWKGKAKDAEDLTATAVKANADLGVAAGLKSTEGVEEAAKEIGAACASCHSVHRERGADNAWMIK